MYSVTRVRRQKQPFRSPRRLDHVVEDTAVAIAFDAPPGERAVGVPVPGVEVCRRNGHERFRIVVKNAHSTSSIAYASAANPASTPLTTMYR